MKSKIAAGVLAFFAGGFGVHRFYLGQVGKGILYAVFFWTGIPFLIAFIDAIIFLTMEDEDFNYKYNPHLYNGGNHNVNININTNGKGTNVNQQSHRDYTYEKQRPKRATPSREGRRVISNPFRNVGTQQYREYDFKGAIKSYQKSLRIKSIDPQIHFNLACLYSLEEDARSAFLHLQKAVEQGYNNYDKIRTHDHLAFLRTQPEFEQFVRNGYTFQAALAAKAPEQMELTDDVVSKLERLASLKEKGILTEDEFQLQKAKLLRL